MFSLEDPVDPNETTSGLTGPIARAIADGLISSRLWFYSNYHCNLTCAYCLTESGPRVARRELDAELMLELTRQGRMVGFTALGITGGEPFLLPKLPQLLEHLASVLPVVVLTNGTLFTRRHLAWLEGLASLPVALQISLDHPDPIPNDAMRGPENFRKVVEVVPRLVAMGIRVRIATTIDDPDPMEMRRLCALHRALGVSDGDHIVRPIIRRGRARVGGIGSDATPLEMRPELTITADGAFWSPFGPTVTNGRLDTDLLLTKKTRPLSEAAMALVRVAAAHPRNNEPFTYRCT